MKSFTVKYPREHLEVNKVILIVQQGMFGRIQIKRVQSTLFTEEIKKCPNSFAIYVLLITTV